MTRNDGRDKYREPDICPDRAALMEAALAAEVARQNGGMAQSSKEKQEAFRARQAMLGHAEVRGIYAPPALHAAIKEAARKLVEQHKPEEKK